MSKAIITMCPNSNCQAVWGFDEMQFEYCDACGYPDNEDEEDSYDDDYDDEDEADPRDHPICGDDSWFTDPEEGAR